MKHYIYLSFLASFLMSCGEKTEGARPAIRDKKTCESLVGYDKAICLGEAGQGKRGAQLLIELEKNGDQRARDILREHPTLRESAE